MWSLNLCILWPIGPHYTITRITSKTLQTVSNFLPAIFMTDIDGRGRRLHVYTCHQLWPCLLWCFASLSLHSENVPPICNEKWVVTNIILNLPTKYKIEKSETRCRLYSVQTACLNLCNKLPNGPQCTAHQPSYTLTSLTVASILPRNTVTRKNILFSIPLCTHGLFSLNVHYELHQQTYDVSNMF